MFWCPCWLFLSLLGFLFLFALACTGEKAPSSTLTPEQNCLVQETRLDRTQANLDRAYHLCYNGETGGDQWKDK